MLRYLLVIIDDSAKIGGWMVIGSCSWEMPIPGYQSVDVTTSSTTMTYSQFGSTCVEN